ncbi:hypothetical protein THAOC_25584, partial [Thalassiosira oceanica]
MAKTPRENDRLTDQPRSLQPLDWCEPLGHSRHFSSAPSPPIRYEWSQRSRGKERYVLWCAALRKAVAGRDVAAECLTRAAAATWWEWNGGSTLVFWKWPKGSQLYAREGQPHFQTKDLPAFRQRQRPPQDDLARSVMKSKVDKFRGRAYVVSGDVLSLIHMFAVDKGLHDKRMVFDATASGLNDA